MILNYEPASEVLVFHPPLKPVEHLTGSGGVSVLLRTRAQSTRHSRPQVLYEKRIRLKPLWQRILLHEILILLVMNILCNKLHCQKGLNLILFSYKLCFDLGNGGTRTSTFRKYQDQKHRERAALAFESAGLEINQMIPNVDTVANDCKSWNSRIN